MRVPAWKLALLALLVLSAAAGKVRADDESEVADEDAGDEVDVEALDEEEPEEEDEDVGMDLDEEDEDIDASQDVEAVAYFVNNQKHEFPSGSEATALISFDNQGTGPFEVKSIEGSFRYPQDFRYFLQNFSIDVVNVTVPPGEQTTFVYKFKPSDQFDPRDIGLVININYIDQVESLFRDAVFNDTVFITEPTTPVDYPGMVVYTVGFFAACYYAATHVFRDSSAGAASSQNAKTETGTEGDLSEWLPDEMAADSKKNE